MYVFIPRAGPLRVVSHVWFHELATVFAKLLRFDVIDLQRSAHAVHAVISKRRMVPATAGRRVSLSHDCSISNATHLLLCLVDHHTVRCSDQHPHHSIQQAQK